MPIFCFVNQGRRPARELSDSSAIQAENLHLKEHIKNKAAHFSRSDEFGRTIFAATAPCWKEAERANQRRGAATSKCRRLEPIRESVSTRCRAKMANPKNTRP